MIRLKQGKLEPYGSTAMLLDVRVAEEETHFGLRGRVS
jgi:hypothetical protein